MLKCGIVGLPNVGKSTLFNALTSADIPASNYPFCTIDPNIGTVTVHDTRLESIAKLAQSKEIIPAITQFVDIAGLVAGAAQGEGLGNQFLSNIRSTDAIVHVLRCFDNNDVTHVAGQVDPMQDRQVIDNELILSDLAVAEKALQKSQKASRSGLAEAKAQTECLQALIDHLSQGQSLRTLAIEAAWQPWVDSFQFITCKPVLYVANVDDQSLEDNQHYQAVKQHAEHEQAAVVAICAAIESEIAQLDPASQIEFLSSMGLTEPGLNRLIRACYALLGLETYFTAGPKEARAWTIPKGACAPQAAGIIHSDFERGFIRAEVIAYQDYINHQGEQGAKSAGKWRSEGKEYIIQDGDVILFRFNV